VPQFVLTLLSIDTAPRDRYDGYSAGWTKTDSH